MTDTIGPKFRFRIQEIRERKPEKTEEELRADRLARRLKRIAFTIWLIALMLPAFRTTSGNAEWGNWLGLSLLILMPVAFMGAYLPQASLALYANLFFLVGIVASGRQTVSDNYVPHGRYGFFIAESRD